jgi:hypothetical protein
MRIWKKRLLDKGTPRFLRPPGKRRVQKKKALPNPATEFLKRKGLSQ